MSVVQTKPAAVQWCFRCRKRLAGTWELHDDRSGYLGPWWSYRCNGCHEDHRHFPGCGPL